ncbi:ubiquitin carboxyl-terminal hydrolase CYLD isoform X2 [Anopheles coustani]|nr:ubiquitin carboxyl-terminal hydrolase CYLD isoform X2 [Anopheles coustani]
MACEPRETLIVAANFLVFPEQDFLHRGKQHHSRRNILGNFVNSITRRAGGDSSSKSAARSGGKSSVNGDFQPYTQRSYTPDLTTSGTGGGASNRKSTDLDALCDSFSCLPMDPTGAKAMQHKKMAASISSPNLSKQDSSSSTGSSGRYVHSHPVESVMMHNHGQNHSHHHHHHQHAVNDEAYRSSGRSSQNSSNSSTLKHSKARTSKSGHRPTGSNTSVNSGGFLSLPDRDLVVIDPSEIDEANKSAGNVILVNPPRSPVLSPTDSGGVDLMDLLHTSSSWPAEAGVVADSQNIMDKKTQTPSSLSAASYGNGGLNVGYNTGSSSASSNSTSSTSHYNHNGTATERTNGRSKSFNPLAHFGNSKPGEVPPLSTTRKAARTAAVEAKPATVDVATMTKINAPEGYGTSNGGHGASFGGPAVSPLGRVGDNGFDNTIPGAGLLPRIGSISPESDAGCGSLAPSPMQELPNDPSLGLGSVVEVTLDPLDATAGSMHANAGPGEPLYHGVIRWIGPLPTGGGGGSHRNVMVGVELEEDPNHPTMELSNGTFAGKRLFKCPANRAIFVREGQCSHDRRFQDMPPMSPSISRTTQASSSGSKTDTTMFGKVECPVVKGRIPPLKILKLEDLKLICGMFKGIQGHHNSCYLDATLFAMFTFTSVFDSLLFRPKEPEDNPQYEEVQRVLLEEIVNPLRKNHFVRADRVLKLRELLDQLSSVTGLMSEEKDPEEFLNSLLAQILRADPFLKLSSGLDTFYYQLFVEKDERLNLPSVQQLFEQSFLASNIKLKEVPSCLIIQMPRFGKNFKMYPRILPSQVLDVTDIIEDSPRQCCVCGKVADFECRDCFGKMRNEGLEETAICKNCIDSVHQHNKRINHKPVPLTVPQDFIPMAAHCEVPRLYMELFAVVCIETSHYVAFVKAASGQDAPWCFFDSMADRNGEQNGHNIPKMVPVPDLPHWLTDEGSRALHEEAVNDKMLPEHAKRLLCDAYMCMYQSTDVMMYR